MAKPRRKAPKTNRHGGCRGPKQQATDTAPEYFIQHDAKPLRNTIPVQVAALSVTSCFEISLTVVLPAFADTLATISIVAGSEALLRIAITPTTAFSKHANRSVFVKPKLGRSANPLRQRTDGRAQEIHRIERSYTIVHAGILASLPHPTGKQRQCPRP